MLGCRDCLGKLLRQSRHRLTQAGRQQVRKAGLGSRDLLGKQRGTAGCVPPQGRHAHTFSESRATPANACLHLTRKNDGILHMFNFLRRAPNVVF